MHTGDMVTLRAYGGEKIVRVMMSADRDTINVCRKEEHEAAKRENREPRVVGFPRVAIVTEGESVA